MYFFVTGILLGLSAGIAPGPLLTLVISETVRHNKKAGILAALAPVITDFPIILISLFVLSKLSDFNAVLGTISFLGALFISYLAYENITVKGINVSERERDVKSLKKGVITNFLSPHPYLFWMIVGAPIMMKAYHVHVSSAVLFISGFYMLLVGSKIMVAFLVERSKSFLKSTGYIYTIRILGGVLIIFAGIFFRDGLRFFGLIQ
jgi:threonine/homoserine/homoserine lactone efflux protein